MIQENKVTASEVFTWEYKNSKFKKENKAELGASAEGVSTWKAGSVWEITKGENTALNRKMRTNPKLTPILKKVREWTKGCQEGPADLQKPQKRHLHSTSHSTALQMLIITLDLTYDNTTLTEALWEPTSNWKMLIIPTEPLAGHS